MGNSASKPGLSAHEKAVFKLKKARDDAHRYQEKISQYYANEHERAKEFLQKDPPDKKRALQCLKRKKYYESIVKKASDQHEQLQNLVFSIEQAKIQKGWIEGLEAGNRALTAIHEEMGGVERVEKIMNQSADAIADEQEISNILGGKVAYLDDDAVNAEFKQLEDEAEAKALEAKRLEAKSKGEPLPEVPTAEPIPEEKPEAETKETLPSVPTTELSPEEGAEARKQRKERESNMLKA